MMLANYPKPVTSFLRGIAMGGGLGIRQMVANFGEAVSIYALTPLPLFLITLTGQYMPGMLVLRNDGFKTSANPIVTVTGLGSLLMAPFGSHAFNIAAITAAICTGREAHEDHSKRWIAGLAAGLFSTPVGVFGVALAALLPEQTAPPGLIPLRSHSPLAHALPPLLAWRLLAPPCVQPPPWLRG